MCNCSILQCTRTDLDCSADVDDGHLSSNAYIIYIIEGVLFGLANAVIIGTVFKHPYYRQRKEYWMISALALADIINEIAFTVGGIYRIQLTDNITKATACASSWECMMHVQNVLWSISFPLVYFMLLCISVDRFLCVYKPLLYHTFTIKYSLSMAGFFYLCAFVVFLITMAVSYISTYGGDTCVERYQKVCLFDHVTGNTYAFHATTGIQLACGVMSVAIYGSIPFLYRKQVKNLKESNQLSELRYLRTQKRLLVTLGISSLCTFLLMVLPGIFRMSVYGTGIEAFPWAGIVMNANPAVNTFLFIFRHEKFRKGVVALFTCKSLPRKASVAPFREAVYGIPPNNRIRNCSVNAPFNRSDTCYY